MICNNTRYVHYIYFVPANRETAVILGIPKKSPPIIIVRRIAAGSFRQCRKPRSVPFGIAGMSKKSPKRPISFIIAPGSIS